MGYKCVNCGEIKEDGDDCFKIRIILTNGNESDVYTCTENCATNIIKVYTGIHQRRVDRVKYQQFEKRKYNY